MHFDSNIHSVTKERTIGSISPEHNQQPIPSLKKEKFFTGFSEEERKTFLKTFAYQINQCIAKRLEKSREERKRLEKLLRNS